MSQKLAETIVTPQAQGKTISEAKTRISELEASGPLAEEALLMLKSTRPKKNLSTWKIDPGEIT